MAMLQQRLAAGCSSLGSVMAPARPVAPPSRHLAPCASASPRCAAASASTSLTKRGRSATRAVRLPSKGQRRREGAVRVAFKASPVEEDSVLASIQSTELSNIASFNDGDLYDNDRTHCPHGNVIGIMRSIEEAHGEKEPGFCSWPQQVFTSYPDETLQAVIPRLNRVTGLPVIDRTHGKVIGVISRKDIIKVRNAQGSMEQLVSDHMTSPAITVVSSASVQQAADLMLKYNIRRLPVVDEDGYAVGIVSRSDIFKPLFKEAYTLYMEKEKAAMQGAMQAAAAAASSPSSSSSAVAAAVGRSRSPSPTRALGWQLKYLYDGDCPMCQSLMNVLKRQDNSRGLIEFVNIADDAYNPRNHMGITYEEAMTTIHALRPDGTIVQGTDALKELFNTVGLGWAVYISDLPVVAALVDILYQFLSANRLSLGGALDGIIAAKRMDMSKKGVETCGDIDEGCAVEW